MLVLSTFPTLHLTDLNQHIPLGDPLHFFLQFEIRLSEPFVDLAAD
jgi:hypothetical protein